MTQEFEREQRYVVLKVKDVMQRLSEKDILTLARILDEIDAYRKSIGKKSLECVVIESDWPEYEPTWKAIEARVTGAQAQNAPSDEYVGWYCAHCERGVDASEVTYHEHHQACGRVITDDRPPSPVPSVPKLHVGNLPTVNQDAYPALGAWWVQLWDGDSVAARVYGASPEEARSRAAMLAAALGAKP